MANKLKFNALTPPFDLIRNDLDDLETKDHGVLTGKDDDDHPQYSFDIYDAIVDAAGGGDFTDIQSAIDSGALSIWIRSGTYTLSSDIIIASSGTLLMGEDKVDVIIDFDSNSNQITTSGGIIEDCLISGLTVKHSNHANGALHFLLIGATYRRWEISNCIFIDNVKAIEANSFSFGKIFNNNFNDTDDGGKPHATTVMIDFIGGSKNIIAFNNFQRESLGGDLAIRLDGTPTEYQISSNIIQKFEGNTMQIGATSTGNRIFVDKNIISALPTGFGNGSAAGILINASICVISNNRVDGFKTTGIVVQGSKNTITNNLIDAGGFTSADGILIDGNYDNNILINNYINATNNGINIASADVNNTIVTNNNLADSATAFVDSGTNSELAHNLV